jgi:hypothetical protein
MKLSIAVVAIAVGAGSASAFAPSSSSLLSTLSSTSSLLAAKFKVFIDGEAGTTGLQVRGRIEARDDLEIISPPNDLRKDQATRKKLINEADVVILCTLYLIYIVTVVAATLTLVNSRSRLGRENDDDNNIIICWVFDCYYNTHVLHELLERSFSHIPTNVFLFVCLVSTFRNIYILFT